MATDEDAFLAAIRTAPGNRTTRLIYADWLEERNDPRHELVRVCEAMREVPVWSDRYWELKARRNELWLRCPIEWLEATGYDGSSYDSVFRDGVPAGWRERWRLIREFTERWHGIDVPDAGGRQHEVRQAEEQLGVEMPPSLREYVAYAHDVGVAKPPAHDSFNSLMLFHCAYYQLDHLNSHPAVSLIHNTLSGDCLGVAHEDLNDADPPTYYFSARYANDVEYDPSGVPYFPDLERPVFCDPSLSLSIFRNLFIELPTAGSMEITVASADDLLARLAADFPIHASFEDADVYETDEVLVLVGGPRSWHGGHLARRVEVIVRRPIRVESVPDYLFGTDDRNTSSTGMLGPAWFRRQQEEELSRPGVRQPPRWTSVLRRREEERSRETGSRQPGEVNPYLSTNPLPPGAQPPPPDLPGYEGDDAIPF
jgi:uncharacterized protein (TIGR02996 family)